jgi:uncharacterized membrane protein
MDSLKIWVTSFISFIVLDVLWFMGFANKFNKEKIAPIARLKQDGSLQVNFFAALLVYILLATAFSVFLWPKIKNLDLPESLGLSTLLGLIIYGVYDLTNISFLKHWPYGFAAVDIFWGALAFSLTALITKLIFKS